MAYTGRLFPEISNEILKNKPGFKKRFKLLFQAKNPKDLDEFHSKCDGKGPTLTLLHGKGNVFGGYTSKDWFSGETMRKRDDDAFLFYMNVHDNAYCNFFPIHRDYVHRAITSGTHLGPTFGGGFFFWQDWDLNTFDLSRRKKPEMKDGYLTLNGTLNYNFAYKCRDPSFVNNEINGGTLCVKMLEVYQVEDEIWMSKPKENEVKEQKNYLLKFETLRGSKIPKYNILLLGAVGSGKSSFYNTLVTAVSGDVRNPAQVAADTTLGSVTNSVHAYDIISTKSDEVNVQIYDIRGFETERDFDDFDFDTELKDLLKGELSKNYQFPEKFKKLEKKDLKENSSMKDKIHLVCFVTDATTATIQRINHKQMERNIIHIVHKQEIPLVCVATKLDRLCPRIKENVDNLFRSPVAFRTIRSISQLLGVLEKHVFPIVNYTNESETSPTKDALAVQALYAMVRLIEDCWTIKVKDARDTWTERTPSLRSSQENISESTKQLQQKLQDNTRLNVVCVGPKGSGKSSFIDSINSAMTGIIGHKVAGTVCSDESDPVSSTKLFQLYAMSSYDKETNVMFGDMPGFQENGGIELEHVKMVINGHVPEKFKIQEGINQSDIRYIQTTNRESRIHCVCFVFDVSSVDSLTSSKKLEKCTGLIKWLSDSKIPFIVVITKSDKLSSAVYDNTLEVIENWLVRKNKNKLLQMLRIKESIVFPIRNYVNERRLNPDIDALLIEVIQEILRLGNDYLKEMDDGAYSL